MDVNLNSLLKMPPEMSKIAIYFCFSLVHAHTKQKLLSFTIREGTILSLLNNFYITWHTREKDILAFGELLVM